jgi:hypothetical protein
VKLEEKNRKNDQVYKANFMLVKVSKVSKSCQFTNLRPLSIKNMCKTLCKISTKYS